MGWPRAPSCGWPLDAAALLGTGDAAHRANDTPFCEAPVVRSGAPRAWPRWPKPATDCCCCCCECCACCRGDTPLHPCTGTDCERERPCARMGVTVAAVFPAALTGETGGCGVLGGLGSHCCGRMSPVLAELESFFPSPKDCAVGSSAEEAGPDCREVTGGVPRRDDLTGSSGRTLLPPDAVVSMTVGTEAQRASYVVEVDGPSANSDLETSTWPLSTAALPTWAELPLPSNSAMRLSRRATSASRTNN